MNWYRILSFSARALLRARHRTLLSAGSMAIGIAAVVLLFGVGGGAQQAFQEALQKMGRNLLVVGSQFKQSNSLRGSGQRYQTLTLDDWRAITEEIDYVERAAPIAMQNFDLRYAGESMNATVIGTTPEFQLTNNQMLTAGRFLDDYDLRDTSRVAVIGSEVADELFADIQPVGQRLLVGNAPFRIIGVLQEKGVDPTGEPQDNRILVPVSTAQRRLLSVDYVDRIFIQTSNRDVLGRVLLETAELLRELHGFNGPAAADDFTIRDQAGLLKTLQQTDRSLTRFLAGIAALSLAMAGTGLLAVALLAVRERQAEIGLRLAVGALPRQVLMQFLSETLMIALLGAVAGLLVGICGIILGKWLIGWQLALTAANALYACLISLALSAAFGVYPAFRAARLDPIVALRSA